MRLFTNWKRRNVKPAEEPKPADEPRSGSLEPFSLDLNALLLCGGLASVLRAKSGKVRLAAGIMGRHPRFLGLAEAMFDLGFDVTFFEGDPADAFHPYRPIEQLAQCDVALVADSNPAREKDLLEKALGIEGLPTVPIQQMLEAHLTVLRVTALSTMRSCLNPYKLSMIAAALVLTPPRGVVIECGVYMGGTTIYMALLQRALGIARTIYALDTFEGMPAATDKDLGGGFAYTSGMFTENRIDVVRALLTSAGVANDVELVMGLCQDTLPNVLKDNEPLAFAFLDTDQYAGTKGGLDQITPRLLNDSLIIVDDVMVHGVQTAIEEKLAENSMLYRAPLCTNFQGIFSKRTAHAEKSLVKSALH